MVVRIEQADIVSANQMKAQQTEKKEMFRASRYCPTARALSRATGKRVVVDGEWWWFDNGKQADGLPLPQNVRDFILDWDLGEPVQPLSFVV